MKQLIVNQLDGGFVVQQIVDGQNQGAGVIRTNYGQVVKEGRKFFALENEKEPDEIFGDFGAKVATEESLDEIDVEQEVPTAAPRLGRGRPRKAVNVS